MGFGLISHAAAGTASANAAVTTGAINTTGANLLVVCVTNLAANTPAVSDSAGNTWTGTTRRTTANGAVQILYVVNPTTSSTHTATIGAATNNLASITFMAFTTADDTPFDQEAGSTSATTGSITTTEDGELIVVGFQDASSTSITIGTAQGYALTGAFAVVGGTRFSHATAFSFQGLAGSESMAFTINGGLTPSSSIVSFAPAIDGGSGGSPASDGTFAVAYVG